MVLLEYSAYSLFDSVEFLLTLNAIDILRLIYSNFYANKITIQVRNTALHKLFICADV